jgi:uncharacterized SAM-binding protein YcdF (DUF218 family)
MEMRKTLVTEGVQESMIWSKEHSHSTHEKALYSAQILRNKGISRIVLVTDVHHMYRAHRSFRKQGLEVIPAACGYRSYGSSLHRLVQFLPNWEPIGWNEDSLHAHASPTYTGYTVGSRLASPRLPPDSHGGWAGNE